MNFETEIKLYVKNRLYHFVMMMLVIPLGHISIKEELNILIIVDVIFIIGFIIDFFYRVIGLSFQSNFLTLWRGKGIFKILNRKVFYCSVTQLNLGSFRLNGNDYLNLLIRYKDKSKRLYRTKEAQISFNYFEENDIIKILDIILEKTNSVINLNNKQMTESEIKSQT